MAALEHAVAGLRQALSRPRRQSAWRWLVRHRMAAVRQALTAPYSLDDDAWLASREVPLLRERGALLRRLNVIGAQLLDDVDTDTVGDELDRLLVDLEHHAQRMNDLVYDAVSWEIGGSD